LANIQKTNERGCDGGSRLLEKLMESIKGNEKFRWADYIPPRPIGDTRVAKTRAGLVVKSCETTEDGLSRKNHKKREGKKRNGNLDRREKKGGWRNRTLWERPITDLGRRIS